MPRKKTRREEKSLPYWPFGLLSFAVLLAIDQYTKHAIATGYALGQTRHLFSIFSFTYVQNTGALWSSFQGMNGAFIWLSVIAFGALIYYHDAFTTLAEKISYTLILTGLWGNLLDRLAYGFVVDFISVGWWPVFNIADSAINVGIVIYLLEQWRTRKAT